MKQETENDIWDDKKGDQSEKEKAVFDLYINFYPGVSGHFLWISMEKVLSGREMDFANIILLCSI